MFTRKRRYLLSKSDLLEFVRRGENFFCPSAIVVVKVLGDKGAGPDEVVVLVKEETGPWKLSRAGATKLQIVGSNILPNPTLFSGVDNVLRAGLPPESLVAVAGLLGGDARLAKHRQVNVLVVAAGLLVAGTALKVLIP